MDDRVQLSDGPDRQPHVELVARGDHGDPLGDVRGLVAELAGHLVDGEDRRLARAQVAEVEVVRV